MKAKIVSINFTHDECGNREVHVGLSDGDTVKICACCESWEQYGCYHLQNKYTTVDVADRVNGWLHGGEKPYVEDLIG